MGAGLASWNEQTTTRCTAEPAACTSSPFFPVSLHYPYQKYGYFH